METLEEGESKKVYGTTDGLVEEKVKTMAQREEDEQKTHHKTVDMSELYDGMAVQTEYRDSSYWDDRVSSAQSMLEAEMRKEEEEVPSQANPSVDQGELYNGLALQSKSQVHYRDSPYWEERVGSA